MLKSSIGMKRPDIISFAARVMGVDMLADSVVKDIEEKARILKPSCIKERNS